MKRHKERMHKETNKLAKYAEYANIGGNKTGGFGVTRFAPLIAGKE